MIYAVKHNKVNRDIYKANEDALTSAIFERLMYLPQELSFKIREDNQKVELEISADSNSNYLQDLKSGNGFYFKTFVKKQVSLKI